MLLHPPDLHRSQDLLLRRGRSKHVAPSAQARKLSEERRGSDLLDAPRRAEPPPRPSLAIAAPVPLKASAPPHFIRDASPSPPSSASMSPDYWDSPPSPPRSLEDQVHIAYADDNYHLAKKLLLRLKGIDVTDDDDPRIAAVRDEDFDFCFAPHGALISAHEEKAALDMQRREMAQLEERRRTEWVRNCQRKWEDEKQRLRDERWAVLQRREKKRFQEESRKRKADEAARKQREDSERTAAIEYHRTAKLYRQPRATSFQVLHPPPPGPRTPFVYEFPNYNRPKTSPPVARVPVPPPAFDDARTVPFPDVLKSMQGPLFPLSHDERPRTPRSRSRSHGRRRDARLLEVLLVEIEYDAEERRKRKGKQRALPLRRSARCLACSGSASESPVSSSVSSSSIPRTASWLSFRNSTVSLSASSSTSDLSALSSSPIPSPKPGWFSASRSRAPGAATPPPPPPPPVLKHSCVRPASIPFAESPLYVDAPAPTKSVPISYPGRERSTSSTARAARDTAGVLTRMSKFVELAKGLQTTYATAALFAGSRSSSRSSSAERGADAGEGREADVGAAAGGVETTTTAQEERPRTPSRRPKLRPAGYRVSRTDVTAFLDPTLQLVSSADNLPSASSSTSSSSFFPTPRTPSPTPKYIPLTSPFPPPSVPQYTVLPDPLPYKLHFKPVSSPCRSPFRFHALSELHTVYPSSAPSPAHRTGLVTWRIRSVGNPVHLRLKALHNVVRRAGMGWDGIARDTALGGGRERVVGIAYENLGRTALSGVVGGAA